MRNWLKVLRVQNGWTQKEAGKRLGISQQMYSAIETGICYKSKELPLGLLSDIAKIFRVPLGLVCQWETEVKQK